MYLKETGGKTMTKTEIVITIAFPTIEETLYFVHTCIYIYNNGTIRVFVYTIMVRHVNLCIQ